MDITAALRAFAAVFPAELPDKTMIATVVLVAHYQRPWPVWCGAAAAFTVHVALAVTAGQLLGLLPDTVVTLATATLFAGGAVLLWRGSGERPLDATSPGEPVAALGVTPEAGAGARTTLAALVGSFGVILMAEWGDLTQLTTASIAASTGAPVAVAVGALLALWAVAALAAGFGRALANRLPVGRLRRGAAVVFATLAVVTVVQGWRG